MAIANYSCLLVHKNGSGHREIPVFGFDILGKTQCAPERSGLVNVDSTVAMPLNCNRGRGQWMAHPGAVQVNLSFSGDIRRVNLQRYLFCLLSRIVGDVVRTS